MVVVVLIHARLACPGGRFFQKNNLENNLKRITNLGHVNHATILAHPVELQQPPQQQLQQPQLRKNW